jgi:hypothetical protein
MLIAAMAYFVLFPIATMKKIPHFAVYFAVVWD